MTKVNEIKDTTPPKIAWHLGYEEGIRHMTEFMEEYKETRKKIFIENSEIQAMNEWGRYLKEVGGLL